MVTSHVGNLHANRFVMARSRGACNLEAPDAVDLADDHGVQDWSHTE